MLADSATDTLLTLALVASMSVCAVSLVTIALSVQSARRRPPPGPATPSTRAVLATPAQAVADARARARRAATLSGAPATTPAGPIAALPDGPRREPPVDVDELRDLVDHLVDTNPRFLAEVITTWINAGTTPTPTPTGPDASRSRRPA